MLEVGSPKSGRRSPRARAQPDKADESAKGASRGRVVERVLVVDDNAQYRDSMERALRHDRKQVVCVADGAQAAAVARAQSLQLAIVDLFLAHGESGLDVVRALKAIQPSMFVILISAHLSAAYAMAGVRAGADDCIEKAVPARRLVRRVETGQPIDPDPETALSLEEAEWAHISRALLDADGNRTKAAERLRIYRQTLQRKLKKRLGKR